MRLLLVNYEFPGVTANCGGGGEVTRQLADGLSRRGHDVQVFTDERDGHYATFPLRTAKSLRQTIQEFRPDVVNGHFSLPSSLALPSMVPAGVPIVISVMGADVYDPTRYQRIRPLVKLVNQYLGRRASRVVAPSQDLRLRYYEQTRLMPLVVPYGIDANEWEWRERVLPARPRVLSVCRMVERKHLEAGIQAVERLRGKGVDAEYRIVGTGPMRERLERAHASKDWLSFAGYVDDVQREYNRAHIFALPSLHEAFGVVVLEALASGLPVVASGIGGQRDIITPAVGACAPPECPGRMADHLLAVFEDYAEYQAATKGYVRRAYPREKMTEAYEQVYQSAVVDGYA